jgi:aspartyl-tRNA(Asn)/glutamyl-tRNA(Gln) amidotransferase subunit C
MITRDVIDNLCVLARIGASDDEKESLTKDLSNIVAYVDQIQEIIVPDDIQPIMTVTNAQRSDDHAHPPRTFTEALLAQAPQRDGDYVKVKKVL